PSSPEPNEKWMVAMPMPRTTNSDPSTAAIGPTSAVIGARAVPRATTRIPDATLPLTARTNRQHSIIALAWAAVEPLINESPPGSAGAPAGRTGSLLNARDRRRELPRRPDAGPTGRTAGPTRTARSRGAGWTSATTARGSAGPPARL